MVAIIGRCQQFYIFLDRTPFTHHSARLAGKSDIIIGVKQSFPFRKTSTSFLLRKSEKQSAAQQKPHINECNEYGDCLCVRRLNGYKQQQRVKRIEKHRGGLGTNMESEVPMGEDTIHHAHDGTGSN